MTARPFGTPWRFIFFPFKNGIKGSWVFASNPQSATASLNFLLTVNLGSSFDPVSFYVVKQYNPSEILHVKNSKRLLQNYRFSIQCTSSSCFVSAWKFTNINATIWGLWGNLPSLVSRPAFLRTGAHGHQVAADLQWCLYGDLRAAVQFCCWMLNVCSFENVNSKVPCAVGHLHGRFTHRCVSPQSSFSDLRSINACIKVHKWWNIWSMTSRASRILRSSVAPSNRAKYSAFERDCSLSPKYRPTCHRWRHRIRTGNKNNVAEQTVVASKISSQATH